MSLRDQPKGVRVFVAIASLAWCVFLASTWERGAMFWILIVVGVFAFFGSLQGPTKVKPPPTAAINEMQTEEWKKAHRPKS